MFFIDYLVYKISPFVINFFECTSMLHTYPTCDVKWLQTVPENRDCV